VTPATPDLELDVPATRSSARLVRHACTRLAEEAGWGRPDVSDLQIAVGEACANVVVHAYPADGTGPIHVRMWAARDELTVEIADEGRWVPPELTPGLAMGLPLMSALSDDFAMETSAGGATRVRMTFRNPRASV
jgi:serine/threonine-protein kinase RsbW